MSKQQELKYKKGIWILSIFIIPMVLVTYVRAITKMFDQHKKIAKITFPIWLYIAITGVIVYVMISPYYV